MQTKNKVRTIALIVISILSLSCSTVTNIIATPTTVPTSTRTPKPTATFTPTITPTPTITFTPTPFYEVETGKEIISLAGGFSFDRLRYYDSNIHTASVSFISEDNKVSVYLFARADQSPLSVKGTLNRYMDFFGENFEEFEAARPLVEALDNLEMAIADFTGIEDDEPVRGRMALYEPSDSKLVYFIVVAVGDQRWEREGEKVYTAIASSLSFFPIQIKDGCDIRNDSGYGSAGNPIRIGGGLRLGDQRINDYLDALLGPEGELVMYSRVGVEEVNGMSLEHYDIEYNHLHRNLYFDIYSSNDVSAPSGMTCSDELPNNTSQ